MNNSININNKKFFSFNKFLIFRMKVIVRFSPSDEKNKFNLNAVKDFNVHDAKTTQDELYLKFVKPTVDGNINL